MERSSQKRKRICHDDTEAKSPAPAAPVVEKASKLQLASRTQTDHARALVMSMFGSTKSSTQDALRENLSVISEESPFPWPTNKSDDVFVKIAGLWRLGSVEHATSTKIMVRVPGTLNKTGTFHWFNKSDVLYDPPDLMFSLSLERKADRRSVDIERIDRIMENASIDPDQMSLKQLRNACTERGLSKNGKRKNLVNRLRKALQDEKQKEWVKAADSLPPVFVRGEFIYDTTKGKFHHKEITPNKACWFGIQLYETRDYVSASLLLRRYLLETPALSKKDTHGKAALLFILALLKAYPKESEHEIVKQEVDFAYRICNNWCRNNDQLLEERDLLKMELERRRGEVLQLVPRLKVARQQSQKQVRNEGCDIMERLHKMYTDKQLTNFQKWLELQTPDFVESNFDCNRATYKEHTGMVMSKAIANDCADLFSHHIRENCNRFIKQLIVYAITFSKRMSMWKSNPEDWYRRQMLGDIGLHEEIVSLQQTQKIFGKLDFDPNNHLIIQYMLICGLHKLRTCFLAQGGDNYSAISSYGNSHSDELPYSGMYFG